MKRAGLAAIGMGLVVAGGACDRQESATQPAAVTAVVGEPKKRDTWSLEAGDDAMIVTPNHTPTFLDSGRTMASLTEGTRVRFLGKSERREGYARIKVLEGPAADEVGEVLRLELQPFAKDHQ